MTGTDEATSRVLVRALSRVVSENERRDAIVADGIAWTYSALWTEVEARSERLLSVGAGSGSRVGVQCQSSAAALAWWIAALDVGALVCIFPPNDADGRPFKDRIEPHVIARNDTLERAKPQQNGGNIETLPPGAIIFTSGTTGVPKPIVHSQETLANIVLNLLHLRGEATARHPLGTSATLAEELIETSRGCAADLTYASGMPIWTTGGLTVALQALFTGDRLILSEAFDTPSFVDTIRRHSVTNISLTPLLARAFLRRLRSEPLAHSLLFIAVGGAAVPPTVAAGLEEASGAIVVCGYGSSESGPLSVGRFNAGPASRHGSCGLPLPGVEFRIADGDLWVRAASLFCGYLSDDCESIVDVKVDGWWRTGDCARKSGDDLILLGRSDDAIIRSGRVIHALALEQVIETMTGVERAAVVGCPSKGLPEEQDIVAVVTRVPTGPLPTQQDIRRACHEATGVAPQRVVWFDHIPLFRDGSPMREDLRRQVRLLLKR
jgi:acyl-CoA synthetase (AMP-forming)/AMP-acid ligase II